jgi:hypothetical protein
MSKLTHERLVELLDYDPATGVFTWKQDRRNKSARAGMRAGSVCDGYRFIGIDRRMYTEHRLAWFYVYKQWPTKDLDHKDRNKLFNPIDNLREATESQNGLNQSKRKNLSGFKGVSPSPHSSNFVAVIRFRGRKHHLGTFSDPRLAAVAYDKAALSFDPAFAAINKRLGLI